MADIDSARNKIFNALNMKTTSGSWLAALCAASVAWGSAHAAETATVKGDNVNVRGLPSLTGEVVTQVKSGETVTVLDQITVKKPKAGEPAKWVKIQMPANTPVWVNAGFLDTNNLVVPTKLNLRAGPGENYSVLGRVDKGTPLKPIRNVEGWTEVEGVPSAYAYVAADYLNLPGEKAAEGAAKIEPEKATEVAKETPKEEAAKPETAAEPKKEVAMPEETAPALPAMEQVKVEDATKIAPPVDAAPATPGNTVLPTPPLAVPPPALTPPPIGAPVPQMDEPAPRRIVVREGVVKGLVSIQAPTYFELRSTETGKLLNYLHPMSTNIVLKKLSGRKVIVTGEEEMDVRWPSTPVINVQKLEIAP